MSNQSLLHMNSCFVQSTNWSTITTKIIIKMEWKGLEEKMKAENMILPCSLLRCFHIDTRQCAARRNRESFWDNPDCRNSLVKIMTHITGKYSSRQWTDSVKRNCTESCSRKHSWTQFWQEWRKSHLWRERVILRNFIYRFQHNGLSKSQRTMYKL